MTEHQDITTLLSTFQEGYTRRDVNQLDAFMELFTAVVVRQAAGWQFAQVHFSFPTTHFPDERILE